MRQNNCTGAKQGSPLNECGCCETIFKKAAKKGLYEANYFLGLMCLNKNENKLAYYYFNIAAGKSHSLSFYELYKMIKQEKISLDFSYQGEDNKNQVFIHDIII